ncbi:F-box/WD repeat-containing protein 4-like [Homalodisca vitripennis]|uniref:F-box/WD repeat-containing protein 4-like n=2 Tax=Homalodisca vitripennis TaxID=197043 RepID=UPI001EEC5676|nr:F-box/WD repeat-containing protein 4-like [Homalodisca vitripennis]
MENFIHGDQEPDNQLKLVDLHTDDLICIFKFCDSLTLRNLSMTCKRLHDVVREDCIWLKWSNRCMVTNQLSNEVLSRTSKKLEAKERCRISANWRYGCYREKGYNTHVRYMPWLYLQSRVLWISQGSNILAVKRLPEGLKMDSPLMNLKMGHKEDISRFVVTDDMIYSASSDKNIYGWSISTERPRPVFCLKAIHSQSILGIDCKRNILVSGSKDSTIKIWQLQETGSPNCTQTVNVSDRVWCVAVNPSLASIAVGSAGYNSVHPIQLYDTERGDELPITRSVRKNGAAVFDIRWESPDVFLTCGHDTVIRLWDLRLGRCVHAWTDPFNAPGYCLATDQHYSILCGTAHHGRAQLWDKRSTSSVQSYFGRSMASSPVYSLSFDSNQLFLAQDSSINVLDFSGYHQPGSHRADYSAYWQNKPQLTH